MKDALKISIDIRTAGGEKAGKGWYTFNIVQNLLKLDDKNQYILYAKEGIPGFEHFKNAQIKLIKGGGILWHLKVARDVQKEKADIFFAPSSYIIPNFLPKSIKIVITVHDLVAFLFPNNHNKKATIIEKLLLKRAIKKADSICTVSQNTKNDLLAKFPKLGAKKITVINCAASEDFKPIQDPQQNLRTFIQKTNLPLNFFLAVGTLEPRKNYMNLIKAFKKVSDRFPDYYLIIVGKNGWNFEPTFQLIRENYLNKKVHILGYLSNKSLMNLYNLAKALVFPSFYEGFGLPPLEAMQCGCPVIASHTSSMPEVVGESHAYRQASALLINPNSPDQIAAAMIKLIKDPQLEDQLKKKGFKQAKKFSWVSSAKKLLKIFDLAKKQTKMR